MDDRKPMKNIDVARRNPLGLAGTALRLFVPAELGFAQTPYAQRQGIVRVDFELLADQCDGSLILGACLALATKFSKRVPEVSPAHGVFFELQ